MKLNEYQNKALETATYKEIAHAASFDILGYLSSAGSVAERIKKAFRDKSGKFDEDTLDRIEQGLLISSKHARGMQKSLGKESPKVKGFGFIYACLGLVGESGEVAGKLQEVLMNDGQIEDAMREDLKKEIGDSFWYLAVLARELGFTLEDVAEANLEKLESRRVRNKIHGDGDNR